MTSYTCYPHGSLVLFILISWSAQGILSQIQPQPQTVPQKLFCRFRNTEYSPGDIWHPTSSTSYGANCVICTCLNSGRQNCTKQECPTDCQPDKPAHTQHPCCKVCEDRESDSSQSGQASGPGSQQFGVIASDHDSGEEEDEDGDLVTENSEFVSCLHQGKIYRDGESFTANVSGLPISVTDQCMQCVCQSGMVLCQMKACSSFKCNQIGSNTFSLASIGTGPSSPASMDACCQRCAAWKSSSKQERSDTREEDFGIRLGGGGGSSLSGGGYQKERFGDQIQQKPVFTGMISSGSPESAITFRDVGGGFGGTSGNNGITMSNGNSAVITSSTKEKSRQYDDCISAGRYYMHGSNWHPIIGPFGVMECVVCKCLKGQIDCGRLKCPPKKEMPCEKPVKVEGHCCPICTSMINNDGSKLCVSGKQEVTAYRSYGNGVNATELINFAFVKQRRSIVPQVDLHEWTLRDGDIQQFSTKYISLLDFNEVKGRQTFTLLGATNEKNLDKFTRREKKLEKRCSTRCSIRISSLERSLRIHRLIARKQCLTHERSVNT